ncbi:MAG: DUF3606 domain-containing protein [Burkholderiales bacterium]
MSIESRSTASHAQQRIDLLDGADVAYWCRVLAVDMHELRRAVQQAGPQAAAVRTVLEKWRSAGPSAVLS